MREGSGTIGAMYMGARELRHPLKLLWDGGHPLEYWIFIT